MQKKKADGFIRPLSLSKNTQITGERCSPLHTNSVFSPFVGDGALDVPLVSDFFNKLKGRFYPSSKFFQTHYRSYSVMRFKSFILIHIFICDVHNIVKPEVFYRSNGYAHAY